MGKTKSSLKKAGTGSAGGPGYEERYGTGFIGVTGARNRKDYRRDFDQDTPVEQRRVRAKQALGRSFNRKVREAEARGVTMDPPLTYYWKPRQVHAWRDDDGRNTAAKIQARRPDWVGGRYGYTSAGKRRQGWVASTRQSVQRKRIADQRSAHWQRTHNWTVNY